MLASPFRLGAPLLLLLAASWLGGCAADGAPVSPASPPALPPPLLAYHATISAKFTISGTLDALNIVLTGRWDAELMEAFVDATTAYFGSPKDVAFTWGVPEPPLFIQALVATTQSASSTAIIEQNFTDLTVGTFNSLLEESLQGSSLPKGAGDIRATSISPPVVTVD